MEPKNPNWFPSNSAQICSDHFLEKYIIRVGQNVRLTDDAVPTRFKARKLPPKREFSEMTVETAISTSISPPRKKVYFDHDYCIKDSPRKIKRESTKVNEKNQKVISSLRKRLRTAQRKYQRYKCEIIRLKDLVQHLKKSGLITSSSEYILKKSLSGIPLALMNRVISTKKNGKGRKYSDELTAFALTLQFYSSKAYDYVRKVFNLALPSQSHIRKLYSKIPADPGFTEPAFVELKKKVEEAKKNGKQVVCSLMLDEMAIRKQVTFDGERFRGYVDLGADNDVEDDSTPQAKEALVFMVVCVNSSWKIPCAYFLIEGLSGTERANLIKICIQRLSDIGVRVISVTCDGPSCHFKMLRELGASLKPPNVKPYFENPGSKDHKVYALLDICHMIKLVRNAFNKLGTLLDKDGKKIEWKYFIALHEYQDSEGLTIANKLRKAHINWWQQKMKVPLAVQLISDSVAGAIEFCSKDLKRVEFQGCEATVRFIRIFNRLFDIFNSRNPFAKESKSPMRVSNKDNWNTFLEEAYDYILGLKDTSETYIWKTPRKTGFIGFLVAIRSFQRIFQDLVEVEDAPLKYVLTYKFSQDHLELFFGAIRAAGRTNNNPSAQQFVASYKRLLLKTSIKGGNGNVIARDKTDILHIMNDTYYIDGKQMTTSEASIIRRYNLSEIPLPDDDDEYTYTHRLYQVTSLSEGKTQIVRYIAGYAAKMANRTVICMECCQSLGFKEEDIPEARLIKHLDRGGLFKPTPSVMKVCEEAEKSIVRMLKESNGYLPHGKGVPGAIATAVLSCLGNSDVFSELNEHCHELPIGEEYHIFALIKTIARCYCKVRFHRLAKVETENTTKVNSRSKLHKTIIFLHQ